MARGGVEKAVVGSVEHHRDVVITKAYVSNELSFENGSHLNVTVGIDCTESHSIANVVGD